MNLYPISPLFPCSDFLSGEGGGVTKQISFNDFLAFLYAISNIFTIYLLLHFMFSSRFMLFLNVFRREKTAFFRGVGVGVFLSKI